MSSSQVKKREKYKYGICLIFCKFQKQMTPWSLVQNILFANTFYIFEEF